MSRFLFLFFTVFPFYAFAQNSVSYSTKQYTDANGLGQNSVKSIVMDNNGFIWLATEAGLTRFDGSNFLLYEKATTGTRSNRIVTITKSLNDGKLYAETEHKELILIHNGHALSRPISYSSAFGLKKGTLKIAHELPLKYPDEQKFIIRPLAEEKYTISKDSVFFNKGMKNTGVAFKHSLQGSFFTSGKHLIYSDNKGEFTLFRDNVPVRIPLTGDLLKEAPFHNPLKIYWNNSTDQAFINLNERIYQIEYTGGKLSTALIIDDFDLEKRDITTVFYDQSKKRLFLGSFSQGLFVLQLHDFNTVNPPKHMSSHTTYAQIPFGDNTVLFANGELLSTIGASSQLSLFNSYSNNFSLVIDKHKNIWTQNGQSVYQLSPNGDKLLRTFNFPDLAACLYMDQDSLLWIGTRGGIYTARQDSIPELVVRLKDVTYLKKENDVLWIGSFQGLYQYHLLKKTMSAIPQLANANIRSILIRKEEVWISTYGDGFYLYNKHRLTKMPLDRNQYLNHTHCLIEDKKGFFWISTNKGLFQVAVKDLITYSEHQLKEVYYAYFDKTSGFKTNEFNGGCQPCGSILNNGFFVFPSLEGSVLFNPLTIVPELPDKPIYVDKITIDNVEIREKDTISVNQDFERMEVLFSSPYFGNQENLQFEYRLSADGRWLKLTGRTIVFSKLQHGTYGLCIRKLNGFNSEYTIKKLIIIVRPYFYQSWWFYCILTIIAAAALLLYIKKRTRMILLKNERLEDLIKRRTEDLEKNIINLEESQYLLDQQTLFQKKLLAAITHDLKSPLKYITIIGKQLYSHEAANSMIKDSIKAIYISANAMYHSTENLLNYSKLFLTEKTSKDDFINLNRLVSEKIMIFSEIARHNGTVIYNNISEDVILHTKHVMLSVIIHNLLDNAIKFSRYGRIDFGASTMEGEISFWVQDTGYGIPQNTLNWLNSEEKQDITDGLGLKMVKEFAAKMNLKIEVESKIDVGTIFKLTWLRT